MVTEKLFSNYLWHLGEHQVSYAYCPPMRTAFKYGEDYSDEEWQLAQWHNLTVKQFRAAIKRFFGR